MAGVSKCLNSSEFIKVGNCDVIDITFFLVDFIDNLFFRVFLCIFSFLMILAFFVF